MSTAPVSVSVYSQFKRRTTSFSIKGPIFHHVPILYIYFLFMKSSINCKTTHEQGDNRNAATDRILTPGKVAVNANESLEAEVRAVLLTELHPWVCFAMSWKDPDFKVFLPILILTTGRHVNSIYRSRRLMLMSSWLVKNILMLENILASVLGANWALWKCSAWLVHINTKEWKIQFCSSSREGTKKKKNHCFKTGAGAASGLVRIQMCFTGCFVLRPEIKYNAH